MKWNGRTNWYVPRSPRTTIGTMIVQKMATLRSFLKNMGISAMEFEFVLRTFALVLTMLSVVHLVGCLWLA
eukprot:COSAG01_NODE_69682_length_260_cov_1.677019_1_plen_70_part_01